MARLPRFNLPGIAQHVVQRGINRGLCFFDDSDRQLYLDWLSDAAKFHCIAIHAYALMSNHVHLLVAPSEPGGVSAMMQMLGRRYVKHVNWKHDRTGGLWEGRFKACLVDSDRYALAACRYIDLNPVRAGLVSDPAAYRWSSYSAHSDLRREPWLQAHDAYLALGPSPTERGRAYRELCGGAATADDVSALRTATAKQMIYGSETFKDRLALASDRRVRPARRSPAP